MMQDPSVDFHKISNLMWPIFSTQDTKQLKDDFYLFLANYATYPEDIEAWPIVRIFEIWGG